MALDKMITYSQCQFLHQEPLLMVSLHPAKSSPNTSLQMIRYSSGPIIQQFAEQMIVSKNIPNFTGMYILAQFRFSNSGETWFKLNIAMVTPNFVEFSIQSSSKQSSAFCAKSGHHFARSKPICRKFRHFTHIPLIWKQFLHFLDQIFQIHNFYNFKLPS